MPTETGTIDLKAQKEGHDDAAKTATNFIQADSTGIRIANANPATATTYQHQTATATEFVVGGTSMAEFGGSGSRIGATSGLHTVVDGDSFDMFTDAAETKSIFHVGYPTGATVTDTFIGDGSTKTFTLNQTPSGTVTVTVDGTATSAWTRSGTTLTFTTAPSDGAVVEASYPTAAYIPYYTLGVRSGSAGERSVAEGQLTTASGNNSHAEGGGTKASGGASHAEGFTTTASGGSSHAEGYDTTASGHDSHAQNYGTIAAKRSQTALGVYNVEDTSSTTTHPSGTAAYGQYAVIVGNGRSEIARSNAFAVDWNGGYHSPFYAGFIQMFAGSTAPSGWLICDGSAVSRTTYAKLYAVIGTTYGTGDGSTTFNLPDLRGRAPIGAGTGSGLTARTLGGTVGQETVTLTAAQSGNQSQTITSGGMSANASHSHTGTSASHNYVGTVSGGSITRHTIASGSGAANMVRSTQAFYNDAGTASVSVAHTHSVTVAAKDATEAHTNMQPSAVVNFIICTGL